jgi:hypothetical protein
MYCFYIKLHDHWNTSFCIKNGSILNTNVKMVYHNSSICGNTVFPESKQFTANSTSPPQSSVIMCQLPWMQNIRTNGSHAA